MKNGGAFSHKDLRTVEAAKVMDLSECNTETVRWFTSAQQRCSSFNVLWVFRSGIPKVSPLALWHENEVAVYPS